MDEVLQLQDELRQELDWARSNGYVDNEAVQEIVGAYKEEFPHYSNWFDEVLEEYYR